MKKVPTFEEIFTLEHLLKSHLLCRKCKQHKKEIINFELNLASNLVEIQKNLFSGKYNIGKYKQFYVYEPKKRLIESLSYKHRVVQRCLCEFAIKPVVDSTLIYDNCACRINKGSHFALKRLRKHIEDFFKNNTNGWALVCDINKFFPSINHEIALKKMKNFNFDEQTFNLIYMFIKNADTDSHKGLPIGNQTSQWISLVYLDALDKFIKHKLCVKHYVRYMDDFIILGNDKLKLKYQKMLIIEFLKQEELNLKLKNDVINLKNGITFLGFVTKKWNKKIIRKFIYSAKFRMKQNILNIRFLEKINKISHSELLERINCYLAHSQYSNFYDDRRYLLKDC